MSRRQKPWTKSTAECFLATEGINADLCDKITKHCKKVRKRAQYVAGVNRRRREDPVVNEREIPPFEYPVLWNRGVLLDCHIDAPMHLLF